MALVAVALGILAVVGLLGFTGGATGGYDTSASAFVLPRLAKPGTVSLVDLRGRPVVVNFFASWCTACRSELPDFAAEASRLRGRIQFVEVDSLETGDGAGMARQYGLARAGAIVARDVGGADGGGLHDALGGGNKMPITAFYDAKARLLGTHVGAFEANSLSRELRRLYGIS